MQFQPKIPSLFTKNLLSKLDSIPENKNVLVLRELFTAIVLSRNNCITFVTDDPEAADAFNRIVMINPDFGNDDNVILINRTIDKKGHPTTDTHAWENWIKGIDMKFDVAIMNPPYDRNLHLKILEKVIPIANKVVNISPVRWLQDPFAKYLKTSDYKKFEESISKKIESLDIIPAEEAIKKFENAEFTMNLGIYVCGNGGYNYDMETPLIKKIIQKTQLNNCMPYSQKKFVQSGNTNQKKYVLNLAAIRTREAGNDTPRIMCKQYANQLNTQIMKQTSLANDAGGHFEFDTEDERKNFWECYNHRFMLWTYTIWKKDAHIKLYKVPYFSNYTKPWTTKMFCDYFDITGYIDDEHAVPGSEWEEIMKQW